MGPFHPVMGPFYSVRSPGRRVWGGLRRLYWSISKQCGNNHVKRLLSLAPRVAAYCLGMPGYTLLLYLACVPVPAWQLVDCV